MMEIASNDAYRLLNDSNDNEDTCVGSETRSESIDDAQISNSVRFSFRLSFLRFAEVGFKLTMMYGVLFGLFATFLWWIKLNVEVYCFRKWYDIPERIHHLRLLSDSVQEIIVFFWPLLTIAPICTWSMIKESNVLFWCAIAGLLGFVYRFFLFIFQQYQPLWKSYVGNVIFCVTAFIVFYKFAKYRQQQTDNSEDTLILTLKICVQLIVGMVIALPYNYIFLNFYRHLSSFARTIVSCSVIALLYIPKLIIASVVTNFRGIYKPNEGIIFAAAFLVISTMVPRLAQAGVESLTYFTIISLFHGVVNILDKLTIPARIKFLNFICRRNTDAINESWVYAQQFIAHQTLIGIITETSTVIMSNAAAYLIVYYYKIELGTMKSFDGWNLVTDMLMKLFIAVCMDWIFNIISLKVQNDCHKLPVLQIWQREWKFIMVIHLIHIIFVVTYFSFFVDVMLLQDVMHNVTTNCIGFFKGL